MIRPVRTEVSEWRFGSLEVGLHRNSITSTDDHLSSSKSESQGCITYSLNQILLSFRLTVLITSSLYVTMYN
jgi:hypothetical protein